MRNKQLKAFLDRLSEDDDLYERTKQALRGQADVVAATIEFASSAGFHFTPDEFDAALRERYADRELTDEQLEAVAGGMFPAVHLGGGMTLAFPDVCKTPSPGGPIPVPYPNIGMSSDSSTTGVKSTKVYTKG